MHHTAHTSPFCPVKALANWVHHLYSLAHGDASLPISFVAPGDHILSTHITLAVRESIILGGLLNCGYSPSRVSAHSLQASGAMALRLNNVGEDLIKKLGRWLSSTWLTYIHAQISSPPQVSLNAWSSTTSSTTSAPKSSVPLPWLPWVPGGASTTPLSAQIH